MSVIFLPHLLRAVVVLHSFTSRAHFGSPHPTPPHVQSSSLFPSEVRELFPEKGCGQAPPHPQPLIYGVPLGRARGREVGELLFWVTSWSGRREGAQRMVSEDSCEKGGPEGCDGVGET